MGSYSFRWEHPAEEVYVTGTFDNWGKTIKLDKQNLVHEKTVTLPETKEKILYKFVADGKWQHDHTAKSEKDHEGNLNNVLYPEDIKPSLSSAHISSVGPGASTLQMAGAQPLLTPDVAPPGTFPDESKDQTFSVNPIPASQGTGNPVQLAPGEKVPDPSTINSNTISSTVHDDPSLKSGATGTDQTFGVAPIPATGGIGNPVQLQPGEKVPDPSALTGNTINSNVKLDQASYEKSDATVPQVAGTNPQTEASLGGGGGIFGLGPQTTNMIPESSMGMGKDAPPPLEGAALSSVGAGSTTAQLAGQQPLQPRGVPQVVNESQKEAHASPEAAANPTAVLEKKEVEQELKAKVPEEPATSGKDAGIAGAVAGGVAAAGAAAVGTAAYLREKTHEATGTDPVSVLPQSVQDRVNGTDSKSNAVGGAATSERATASAVPTEVKESQKEANVSPEAAANPVAVKEKSATEKELLSKVKESQASGQPAPTVSAATTSTALAPQTSVTGAPQLADPVGGGLPPINMDNAISDASKGLNAPAGSQAKPSGVQDSADVSPMTSPLGTTPGQTQPVVTTGVNSSTAPSTSKPVGSPRKGGDGSTPQKRNSIMERLKGTPDSQTSTEPGSGEKKKGFFSKLKEKFKS